MDIHIVNGPMDQSAKTTIQIECNPSSAKWILALSAPFTTNPESQVGLHALPEALIQLGDFLELTEDALPFAYWSLTSAELVEKFIAMMRKYKEAIHFNYGEWRKNFENALEAVLARVGTESDEKLFDAIRSSLVCIEHRGAGLELVELYYNEFGLPVDFKTWTWPILYGQTIGKSVFLKAHQPDFDLDRLREILRAWEEKADPIDDEIPF